MSGGYAAAITTRRFQGDVIIDKRVRAERFVGKTVTFGVWVQSEIKDVAGVHILDFVQGIHDASGGQDCRADGKWYFVTATKAVPPQRHGRCGAAHLSHRALSQGSQVIASL